jgi:hypothetical protein
MTESAVNEWLSHWVSRQEKGNRGLTLKDPAGTPSEEENPKPRRLKKKQKQYVDPDDDENDDGAVNSEHPNSGEEEGTPGNTGNTSAAAGSSGTTRDTRLQFLRSLSEDRSYCRLLLLLDHAVVCRYPRIEAAN